MKRNADGLTLQHRRLLLKELPRFYQPEGPDPPAVKAARRIVDRYEQGEYRRSKRSRARFDRVLSQTRLVILTSLDRTVVRRAIEKVQRLMQA